MTHAIGLGAEEAADGDHVTFAEGVCWVVDEEVAGGFVELVLNVSNMRVYAWKEGAAYFSKVVVPFVSCDVGADGLVHIPCLRYAGGDALRAAGSLVLV